MLKTLKIVIGLSLGLVVVALMADSQQTINDATPVGSRASVVSGSLEGGVFGSVLAVVADWKESDLREVAEKTGETPLVFRQFSTVMAERMAEVWKDSSIHDEAFSQLSLCARTPSLTSPVRALCAANAKRLSLNDASKFQSRFEELEKSVTPEIRDFLDQVKQPR